MSEAKHTPGPWSVNVGQPRSGLWDRTTIVFGKDDNVIATINRHWPEVDANGRLIAAAPDLLASLKLVIATIEDYERINNLAPNPGRKHCWDCVGQAHEIIAKAEGRS
jgi:hypothetical protein